MEEKVTINSLLKARDPSRLLGLRIAPTRCTRTCTKLRNGLCPIAKGDTIDCGKKRRTGCPFMGANRQIDLRRVEYYLMHPDQLALFIYIGLYDSQGVPENG